MRLPLSFQLRDELAIVRTELEALKSTVEALKGGKVEATPGVTEKQPEKVETPVVAAAQVPCHPAIMMQVPASCAIVIMAAATLWGYSRGFPPNRRRPGSQEASDETPAVTNPDSLNFCNLRRRRTRLHSRLLKLQRFVVMLLWFCICKVMNRLTVC